MEFLYLILYACMRLRFLDVETNPGKRRPVPDVCRILCSNVRGLAGNLSDLTVAWYQYDILFCSETLASDMSHVLELLVPGFGRPALFCFCFLFLGSFLNSCGCSTAKSKIPPQETIFLPTYRYRAWVPTIPDH